MGEELYENMSGNTPLQNQHIGYRHGYGAHNGPYVSDEEDEYVVPGDHAEDPYEVQHRQHPKEDLLTPHDTYMAMTEDDPYEVMVEPDDNYVEVGGGEDTYEDMSSGIQQLQLQQDNSMQLQQDNNMRLQQDNNMRLQQDNNMRLQQDNNRQLQQDNNRQFHTVVPDNNMQFHPSKITPASLKQEAMSLDRGLHMRVQNVQNTNRVSKRNRYPTVPINENIQLSDLQESEATPSTNTFGNGTMEYDFTEHTQNNNNDVNAYSYVNRITGNQDENKNVDSVERHSPLQNVSDGEELKRKKKKNVLMVVYKMIVLVMLGAVVVLMLLQYTTLKEIESNTNKVETHPTKTSIPTTIITTHTSTTRKPDTTPTPAATTRPAATTTKTPSTTTKKPTTTTKKPSTITKSTNTKKTTTPTIIIKIITESTSGPVPHNKKPIT